MLCVNGSLDGAWAYGLRGAVAWVDVSARCHETAAPGCGGHGTRTCRGCHAILSPLPDGSGLAQCQLCGAGR